MILPSNIHPLSLLSFSKSPVNHPHLSPYLTLPTVFLHVRHFTFSLSTRYGPFLFLLSRNLLSLRRLYVVSLYSYSILRSTSSKPIVSSALLIYLKNRAKSRVQGSYSPQIFLREQIYAEKAFILHSVSLLFNPSAQNRYASSYFPHIHIPYTMYPHIFPANDHFIVFLSSLYTLS